MIKKNMIKLVGGPMDGETVNTDGLHGDPRSGLLGFRTRRGGPYKYRLGADGKYHYEMVNKLAIKEQAK